MNEPVGENSLTVLLFVLAIYRFPLESNARAVGPFTFEPLNVFKDDPLDEYSLTVLLP